MKDRASKIFGLLFFLSLSGVIIYLVFPGSQSNIKDNYQAIEINGNSLLNGERYLDDSDLGDTTTYAELTLAEVKSILEKHPYVIKAEVRFDGVSRIIAELEEKKPKALILNKNKFNLITESGELLPVLNNDLIVAFPIISNLKNQGKESLNKGELNAAFKIIDAIRFADEEMFQNLAEINLRNGGDILIMFTGIQFPIVFGKKNEARKIVALKNIWKDLIKEKNLNFGIEYVDLRYKNRIFIGKRKPAEITG